MPPASAAATIGRTMTVVGENVAPAVPVRGSLVSRAWSVVLAAWGAFIGVLPHVLHHVGPLAGAALLAGAGGTVLFAAIAIAVSIPFLLRIYRRFRTWIAPAIALGLMAAAFSLSSFVIGPAIAGGGDENPPVEQPGVQQPKPSGHDAHH